MLSYNKYPKEIDNITHKSLLGILAATDTIMMKHDIFYIAKTRYIGRGLEDIFNDLLNDNKIISHQIDFCMYYALRSWCTKHKNKYLLLPEYETDIYAKM